MEKFKGALLVGALRVFAMLPWGAVQRVGSAIGWLMWKLPNRSRKRDLTVGTVDILVSLQQFWKIGAANDPLEILQALCA